MTNSFYRIACMLVLCITAINATGQSLAINADGSTANASALLDIKSINKGLLIPRMNKAEKNAIATPATGLLVFQNAPDSVGFYYYSGSSWVWLSIASPLTGWLTTGNAGTDTSVNFIGTTTNMPLRFKQNNQWAGQLDYNMANVFFGNAAGKLNLRGMNNTAIGDSALAKQSFNPGFNYSTANTAIGNKALANNQPTSTSLGIDNIAVGNEAMYLNTRGRENVALGNRSLRGNITGIGNTAIGMEAAYLSNKGSKNTYIGHQSGFSDSSGSLNTGLGASTLSNHLRGNENTAAGYAALGFDSAGYWNTAIGAFAFYAGGLGFENTGVGKNAGYYQMRELNTFIGSHAGYGNRPNFNFQADSGKYNTGTGAYTFYSLANGSDNVASGYQSMYNDSSGSQNVAIGSRALYNNIRGNGKVAIGYEALYSDTLSTTDLELNTAVGYQAIRNSRFSEFNTAVGSYALLNAGSTGTSTTPVFNGGFNTAMGVSSLSSTTTGFSNTVMGAYAGTANTTGNGNVAIGTFANNNGGNPGFSVSVGYYAGGNNNGNNNTFIGSFSGDNNTSGSLNTTLGAGADVFGANLTNATAVGAGAFVAQSNSLVLGRTDIATNVGIGTTTPNTRLHIDGGTDANVAIATSGYLLMGDATAANLVLDDNEILARNNGAATTLYLQYQSGNVVIGANTAGSHKLSVNGDAAKAGGGTWAVYSDSRLKKNVTPYVDGLSSLLKINPVSFNYNEVTGYDTQKKYIGVIAQELQQVSPYMVSDLTIKANDGTPYLQVDNSAMIYMLINSVKEQQTQITETKKEMQELKNLVLQQQQIISKLQKQ